VLIRVVPMGAYAGGLGVSTTLLVQSLALSLLNVCRALLKVHSAARALGMSKLDYLKQQVQMGMGLPLDALRSNVLYHLDMRGQQTTAFQNVALAEAVRRNVSVETATFDDVSFDADEMSRLRGVTAGDIERERPAPVMGQLHGPSAAFVGAILGDSPYKTIHLEGATVEVEEIRSAAVDASGLSCEYLFRDEGTDQGSRTLDLKGKKLGPVGAHALACMVCEATYTSVCLAETDLGASGRDSAGAVRLLVSLSHSQVMELDLRGTGLGTEAWPALVELIVGGSLTSLDLGYNSIDKEAALTLVSIFKKMDQMKRLGLASCNLGADGASAVADHVRFSGSLANLSLADNGLTTFGKDMSGVEALADALRFNRSLTRLNLSGNKMGPEGVKALAPGIAANGSVTSLILSHNSIGATGVKPLADALAVNSSLTSLDVRHNSISGEGASQLAKVVVDNPKIQMFNKIPIKKMRDDSFTELDLNRHGIGVEGGMVVAGLLPVMGDLTSLNVRYNDLCDEGEDAIRKAVQGREGFDLKM